MNLPNVTNAEVVIVSTAAFLFTVVPALLSLRPKSKPVLQPELPPDLSLEPEPNPDDIEATPQTLAESSPPLLAQPELQPQPDLEPMPAEPQPPAAAPPQYRAPELPQACLVAAAPTDWPRFRLSDLRRAQLDGVAVGLDAATQLHLEAIELAAPLLPRSFVLAARRPSGAAALVDVLLFEELWPGSAAEACAEVSLGPI